MDVGVPVSKDYTGAWWLPAHADNIRPGTNHPKVLVLHTPEEPVDQVEVTPRYFSRQIFITLPEGRIVQRRASTHYYASGGVGTQGDGDLYQMVREDQGAIANGVLGKPYPADTDPNISLNLQSLSIEIEGYAANIHLTCLPGTRQWATVVRWVESRSAKYNIPLDRAHVIGHQEVANNRTDPGGFDIQRVIDEARALRNQNGDDDMQLEIVKTVDDDGNGYLFLTTIPQAWRIYITNALFMSYMQEKRGWPSGIRTLEGNDKTVFGLLPRLPDVPEAN